MKTYTHPTINLPAGAVVVKFYDPDGTGTETTADLIKEIGDVEEGFDINLGELHAGSCDFVLFNIANYVLGTLLNVTRLYVSVVVASECYFYGEVDLQSIETDTDKDPSGDFHYAAISFSAYNIFASLQKTLAYEYEDLVYNDLAYHEYFTEIGTGDIYLYYQTLFYTFAWLCGLKSTAETDVVFDCNRKFYETGTPSYVELNRLIFNRDNFAAPLPINKYRDRLDNAFQILGELCREFGIFPYVVFDGTNFKLSIREIDLSRPISTPSVKTRKKIFKYLIKSIYIFLDNVPDTISVPEYLEEVAATKPFGDHFEMLMHHTNLYGVGTSWQSDYLFKIKEPASNTSLAVEVINNFGDATDYDTHQAAMFNHYKNIYYNNPNWYEYTVKGLKGTTIGVGSATKMENLGPGFYFTDSGINYLIHSTKKSVMNNETKLTVIYVGGTYAET